MHKIALTVPPEILHAFNSLGDICERAIVAGGCLRDTYFGVPYSDIDIFVSPDFNGDALAKKMGESWTVQEQWGSNSQTSAEEYQECFGIHMPSIWQMHEGELPPIVQLMVWPTVPTAEGLLLNFDFGFSQIAFDGREVLATDAFMTDAANNSATFMLGSDYRRLERCHQRAQRIGARHPGRKWIWPMGCEPAASYLTEPLDPWSAL